MSFRAIKRKARRVLHQKMRVPAFYIVPGTLDQVPCYVRVHSEHKALGGVRGTSFAYAEREETSIEIIFMLNQVLPKRGGIVSVEPGEAYCIDHQETPDDITITARVTRLDVADTVGLPVPADYDVDHGAVLDPVMFPRTNPNSSYIEISIDGLGPSTPVSLPFDSEWTVPVDSSTIVADERDPVLATHDFFDSGLIRPYAENDQYFLRLDFSARSLVFSNSVTVALSVPGEAELYRAEHSLHVRTAGEEQTASILTRFFADSDAVASGVRLSLTFENDVEITSLNVYLSL